jgi:multidrug efflux pump subunit AcrB
MKSFSILVVFGCFMLVGICFLPLLPVKLTPSRRMPEITVSYSMPGQSARVVEAEITAKLEGMLGRIRGVVGSS